MFEKVPLPRIDSKGKCICEGDVIELTVPNEGGAKPYVLERDIVEFSADDCAFYIRTKHPRGDILSPMIAQEDFDIYRSRVIGNIHDNPSLEEVLGYEAIDFIDTGQEADK